MGMRFGVCTSFDNISILIEAGFMPKVSIAFSLGISALQVLMLTMNISPLTFVQVCTVPVKLLSASTALDKHNLMCRIKVIVCAKQ